MLNAQQLQETIVSSNESEIVAIEARYNESEASTIINGFHCWSCFHLIIRRVVTAQMGPGHFHLSSLVVIVGLTSHWENHHGINGNFQFTDQAATTERLAAITDVVQGESKTLVSGAA